MAPKIGHNQPRVIVALPPEMADFIIENCDANMRVALGLLQMAQAGELSRKVALMKKFKELKRLIEEAKKSEGAS